MFGDCTGVTVGRAFDFDVVVVGFGPVGAVAACLLGQQGRRVLVLDRERDIFPLPRAIVLDDEAMRLFRSLGLSDQIEPFTTPIRTVQFADPAGGRLVGYDVPSDVPKPNGFFPNYFFHQPSVDMIVRRAVGQLDNVEVALATELVGLEQAADGVEVSLIPSSGERRTVRARYLLGCDGARSTVRSLLSIATHSLGYDHRWLVIDADAFEGCNQPGQVSQICDPQRRATVIKAERGHRRWEFKLADDEPAEEAVKSEFVWRLLKPWASPEDVVLVRAAAYRFHSTFAERWNDGRVFLLGDAAHQMPPFMGQGMCTGLRDASNLTWKLGKVLDGVASSDLLETYADERIPHARDMVEWSVEVGLLIDAFAAKVAGDDGPLDALNRFSGYGAGRELAAVDGAMFDRSTEHRLIGRTVPFLNAGDGRALDDLQGNSFALIRRADSGKADLLVTRLGRQLVDVAIPDDYWTEIERLAGQPVGGAVLVRPDRLVCAIGAPAELLVHLKCMLPGAIEAVGNSQTRKSIVNH
jgi:3-(3-hydroxy-phenyl)propionate hydroxylase